MQNDIISHMSFPPKIEFFLQKRRIFIFGEFFIFGKIAEEGVFMKKNAFKLLRKQFSKSWRAENIPVAGRLVSYSFYTCGC